MKTIIILNRVVDYNDEKGQAVMCTEFLKDYFNIKTPKIKVTLSSNVFKGCKRIKIVHSLKTGDYWRWINPMKPMFGSICTFWALSDLICTVIPPKETANLYVLVESLE